MGDFLKKAYDDAERAKASIWHTPEQIPNPDERILFESKTHGMQFGSYCPVEHYCSRDEFIDPVEPEDVIRWLYIKDIDEWIKIANTAKKHTDDAEQYQKPATTSFHVWPIVVGAIVGNIIGMITYYQIIQPILF